MSRFCLPRDIYHGKGCLEELKNLKGKKAILVVGGGSMKRQGFLDRAVGYLKEAGMEVQLFEGVEPDLHCQNKTLPQNRPVFHIHSELLSNKTYMAYLILNL